MEATTQTWHVELLLSERDGITHAEARLHTGLPEPLTAVGDARLSHDPVDVAEIGYSWRPLAPSPAWVRRCCIPPTVTSRICCVSSTGPEPCDDGRRSRRGPDPAAPPASRGPWQPGWAGVRTG